MTDKLDCMYSPIKYKRLVYDYTLINDLRINFRIDHRGHERYDTGLDQIVNAS